PQHLLPTHEPLEHDHHVRPHRRRCGPLRQGPAPARRQGLSADHHMSGLYSALVSMAATQVAWSAKIGAALGLLAGGALAYAAIARPARARPEPAAPRR